MLCTEAFGLGTLVILIPTLYPWPPPFPFWLLTTPHDYPREGIDRKSTVSLACINNPHRLDAILISVLFTHLLFSSLFLYSGRPVRT